MEAQRRSVGRGDDPRERDRGGHRLRREAPAELEGRLTGRLAPGDTAVVRGVWQGTVLNGRPFRVIEDGDDLVALYLAPGTKHVSYAPGTTDRAEREQGIRDYAAGRLQPTEHTWQWTHLLMLMRPGDAYAPCAFRREADGELLSWYINLQAPFERTAIGFDTMDHILDIVVNLDLSGWTWKDENEAQLVVDLGLATQEMADQVRRDGEAVIELIERGEAWWTDWRDWTPDPSWPIPELPDGWDVT